ALSGFGGLLLQEGGGHYRAFAQHQLDAAFTDKGLGEVGPLGVVQGDEAGGDLPGLGFDVGLAGRTGGLGVVPVDLSGDAVNGEGFGAVHPNLRSDRASSLASALGTMTPMRACV